MAFLGSLGKAFGISTPEAAQIGASFARGGITAGIGSFIGSLGGSDAVQSRGTVDVSARPAGVDSPATVSPVSQTSATDFMTNKVPQWKQNMLDTSMDKAVPDIGKFTNQPSLVFNPPSPTITAQIVNNQFAYPGQMYYLNDFTKEYVGAYHIHPSKGPMVGAKHSPLYHERLVFAEDRRKLKSNEKFLANAKKLDKLAREKSIKVDGLAKYILSGENTSWYNSTRKKALMGNRSIEEQAAREAAWFIDNKESTQVEEILSKNAVLPTSTKNTNTVNGENMSSEGSGGGLSSIASGTSGGGGGGY